MKYLIALGANQAGGGRRAVIARALEDLRAEGLHVRQVSSPYRTPAYPPGSGPDFVNAAAKLEGTLAPEDLLALLHVIEARHGRTREIRWGPRVLDLDLLAAGDSICPDAPTVKEWMARGFDGQPPPAPTQLILPHPRLHERGFVLVPLADIAPDWCHPVTGRTVRAMLADLPASTLDQIVRLAVDQDVLN